MLQNGVLDFVRNQVDIRPFKGADTGGLSIVSLQISDFSDELPPFQFERYELLLVYTFSNPFGSQLRGGGKKGQNYELFEQQSSLYCGG